MLFHQIIRQMSGLGVGIISTNRVDDVNAVLQQLLRADLERGAVSGAVTLLDAVLDIGKLK